MVTALLDTNIIIDHLNNVALAREEVGRYEEPAISSITWIEVLVGASTSTEVATRRFLGRFVLVPLDEAISEHAVILRRRHRLKLPDAVAWASAQVTGRLFVTRDAKDFAQGNPGIRIPYKL